MTLQGDNIANAAPQSNITKGAPSYKLLSKESVDKLSKVPDYPLDYNIYIFKQIKISRDGLAKDDLKDIIEAFKLKDLNQSVDGSESGFGYLTKTSLMHDRLLHYLLLERKRREKIILKKCLNDELSIRKEEDPAQNKLQYELQLLPEEEQHVLEYLIKSPIYNLLDNQKNNESKGALEGAMNFKKLAVVQNIEYNFEEELSDDELVNLFTDCPEFQNFEVKYKQLKELNGSENNVALSSNGSTDTTEEAASGEKSKYDEILNKLTSENIIRIMIPLAGQAVLTGINIGTGVKPERD